MDKGIFPSEIRHMLCQQRHVPGLSAADAYLPRQGVVPVAEFPHRLVAERQKLLGPALEQQPLLSQGYAVSAPVE